MSSARPRVLVISMGPVGGEMAGSGIRAYELARALSEHAEVTLAAIEAEGEPVAGLPVVYYELRDPHALRQPIAAADAIVAQPQWPLNGAWMRRSGARLIFDLYDPEPLEVLQALSQRSRWLRSLVSTLTLDRVIEALFNGHHFICASGKQRDLWVGMMAALRLLGPRAYDRDPSLRSVIEEVPFGVPAAPPATSVTGAGLRDTFAGQIRPEDEVVLWNGGIWNWLDAPSAVRAMALLKESRPQAKLVFMGASDITQTRRATQEARELATRLELLDHSVLFNDTWVPYAERGTWLLEADCAISTQVEHLETRFAFRTRLLDCFWARLPIVCTLGDELADRVMQEDLGVAVGEGDPRALAGALDTVLARGRAAYGERLSRVAAQYTWPRVVEPIARFLAAELPPRLGERVTRPPQTWARTAAFRGALATMNALGVKLWPKL
jgi:glycosyltransferase involved in cell wall biosynthesis